MVRLSRDARGTRQAVTAVGDMIRRLIESSGPVSVGVFMELALYHPKHGYYATRDPIGARGDFTTAPEISQMFGELIGLALVQAWDDRRAPARFCLAELGAGRGTLMADVLRAATIRPRFLEAAEIVLVEVNPVLRARQRQNLAGHSVRWVETIGELPVDLPLFVIANEYFDCSPIRQFVKQSDGWHERKVVLSGTGLGFALDPHPAPGRMFPIPGAPGDVFEIAMSAVGEAHALAARITTQGGMALIVDYGHAQPGIGDTLQAVKAHAYTDILAEPGEADLTAHVDFAALARSMRDAGGTVYGPVTQGAFLGALGLEARAEHLKRVNPATAADIDGAAHRLTSDAEMGSLFKVLGFAQLHTPPLPGFAC